MVYVTGRWIGRGTRKEYLSEEILISPCGCKFRCEPYHFGKVYERKKDGTLKKIEPSGYFWTRFEDCQRHKQGIIDAYAEAVKSAEKFRKK